MSYFEETYAHTFKQPTKNSHPMAPVGLRRNISVAGLGGFLDDLWSGISGATAGAATALQQSGAQQQAMQQGLLPGQMMPVQSSGLSSMLLPLLLIGGGVFAYITLTKKKAR